MISNISKYILYCLFLFIIVLFSVKSATAASCNADDLYGINWTVDGCSCAADSLSKPKMGAFAEDTIGHSRGWIDSRDLICNTKTGKWSVKANTNHATCSGCKAGYGTNGICGPATQKSFATPPTAGLCTCGAPSTVKRKGSWHWQCSAARNVQPADCYAPFIGGSKS